MVYCCCISSSKPIWLFVAAVVSSSSLFFYHHHFNYQLVGTYYYLPISLENRFWDGTEASDDALTLPLLDPETFPEEWWWCWCCCCCCLACCFESLLWLLPTRPIINTKFTFWTNHYSSKSSTLHNLQANPIKLNHWISQQYSIVIIMITLTTLYCNFLD